MHSVIHSGFFERQLDYIFFFYGLSFLVLAAVAFNLSRKKNISLAWGWLALFGLTHGLNEFLDLLHLSVETGSFYKPTRLFLLVSSFVFLMEFGRASAAALRGRGTGPWVLIPFLGLTALGVVTGLTSLDVCARYALGLPGGLWGAWALLAARKAQPQSNRALGWAGWGMGAYALAAGLVLWFPKQPLFHPLFLTTTLSLRPSGFRFS